MKGQQNRMSYEKQSNKRQQQWLLKVIVVFAISAGIFFGINSMGSAATDSTQATNAKSVNATQTVNTKNNTTQSEQAIPVFADIVKTKTISQKIKTSGEIKPMLGVSLIPEASGKIEEIYVDVGDYVKKGQKLAQINDETQQAQFSQAKAALNVANAAIKMQEVTIESAKSSLVSAKAAVEASESQLKNLTVTRKRLEKLFSEGAVSRQDVDDIITKYDNANAAHVSAQTNVKRASDAIQTALVTLEMRKAEQTQATANLNAVKVNLDKTIVDAPFDGVITARYEDPGANANMAKPLFDIEQSNPVKIIGTIIEKNLYQIEANKTNVSISVDSVEGEFKGTVTKIYPSIDNTSRTGKIEIHLDNINNKLRTGMFAKIDVLAVTHENAVVVPRDSLIKYENDYLAYVIEKQDNKYIATRRDVKVGIIDDDKAEVIEGLRPGEIFVCKGTEFVRVGSAVNPNFVGETK
jgi:RND family efflux transporter MFP subunit